MIIYHWCVLVAIALFIIIVCGMTKLSIEEQRMLNRTVPKPDDNIRRVSDTFMNHLLMGDFAFFVQWRLESNYIDKYKKESLTVSWERDAPTSELNLTSEINVDLPDVILDNVRWLSKVKTLNVTVSKYETIIEMTVWDDVTIYQYPIPNELIN